MPATTSTSSTSRGRVPPPAIGRRYYDMERGTWMIRPTRGKAVPLHSPQGERVLASMRPGSFDARQALRRAGLGARQEARAQRRLVSSAGTSFARQTGTGGAGAFLLYLAFSILGLIVLDVALRGRGPAGVQLLLRYTSSAIRRLVSPRDPLFAATPVLAAALPSAGTAGTGSPRASSSSWSSSSSAAGERALERAGYTFLGGPGQGTHARPDWESGNAVDVGLKKGTPVYAAVSGTIGPQFGLQSTRPNDGLRLHLVGSSDELYYAHLSAFAPGIAPGVKVQAGTLLGYSGVSQNGAPHLHLSSRRGSPFAYILSALQGRKGR